MIYPPAVNSLYYCSLQWFHSSALDRHYKRAVRAVWVVSEESDWSAVCADIARHQLNANLQSLATPSMYSCFSNHRWKGTAAHKPAMSVVTLSNGHIMTLLGASNKYQNRLHKAAINYLAIHIWSILLANFYCL